MATLRHYQELIAWQRAMDLVEAVYQITKGFPSAELYGLTSQLRRAVVSIPCNIAEGQCRHGALDFIRFICIAGDSLQEVEIQLLIAQRLGYTSEESLHPVFDLAGETGRLISGLRRSLEKVAKRATSH